MEEKIYAAIDANINRSLEGLRVCEDIFRFVIRNSALSLKIKEIRHQISGAAGAFKESNLLHSRDVEKDIQKFADLEREKTRKSVRDIVKSNLHRSMEAMRSLEEFFKLTEPGMEKNSFQEIRFSLYSLEKEIIPFLQKENKRNRFRSSLYAILDSGFVQNDRYAETAARLINGGAGIIQLRMKGQPIRRILAKAKEVCPLCKESGVLFIVNDSPEVAYLAEADGVHLGQDDLSVRDARALLPADMLVGVSTHSREQALSAYREMPDYIAIGPIYETRTKTGETLNGIGEEIVRDIYKDIDVPIVVIGGMNPEKTTRLKEIGGLSFAVISYLYRENKIEENCREIIIKIR